jgi:hypothetical protein
MFGMGAWAVLLIHDLNSLYERVEHKWIDMQLDSTRVANYLEDKASSHAHKVAPGFITDAYRKLYKQCNCKYCQK